MENGGGWREVERKCWIRKKRTIVDKMSSQEAEGGGWTKLGTKCWIRKKLSISFLSILFTSFPFVSILHLLSFVNVFAAIRSVVSTTFRVDKIGQEVVCVETNEKVHKTFR